MSILGSLTRVRREVRTTGREVSKRFGVGEARQLREMLYYYRRLGTAREEYYSFELYRPDRSTEDKLRYLSQATWRDLTPLVNKRGARFLVHRKSVFGSLLRGWNLPAAPEVALIDVPRALPFEQWRTREAANLRVIYDAAAAGGIVIKPDSAEWGMDILVFTGLESGELVHTTGKRFTDAQLHETLCRQQLRTGTFPRTGRFVVQRRVTAHAELRSFNPVTLPTIRVVTCLDDEDVWVPRAVLKLPVGRAGVDNFHAGGIACPVDPQTGVVSPGIPKNGFDWLSIHPESGIRFEGMRLPYWPEVLATVNRAAPLFGDLKCLGWDLAITDSGPLLIEANYEWGVDIVQRPHRRGINEGRFKEWCQKHAVTSI
jgi:hypothetical protein